MDGRLIPLKVRSVPLECGARALPEVKVFPVHLVPKLAGKIVELQGRWRQRTWHIELQDDRLSHVFRWYLEQWCCREVDLIFVRKIRAVGFAPYPTARAVALAFALRLRICDPLKVLWCGFNVSQTAFHVLL